MLQTELRQKKEELAAIADSAQAHLSAAPEGKLRISKSGNRTQYFWVKADGSRLGEYLPAHESLTVEQLAQKEYDQAVLRLAEQQIRAIDNLLYNTRWGFATHDVADVAATLHPEKCRLVHPLVLTDDEYAAQWQDADYQGKGLRENSPLFYTERNEQVRSKSEILIANALYHQGIPYHYEKPLELEGGLTVHPDFTVLNKRLRREFYWEHLGMMDSELYSRSALRKIDSYTKSGYYPGLRLILTHETQERPLDTAVISHIIRAYLL